MANKKTPVVILALIVIAAAAVLLGWSMQTAEAPEPEAQSVEQPEAEVSEQDTSTGESDMSTSVEPEFDEDVWTCTYWSEGQNGERTCVQWSARRDAAPAE